MVKSVRREVMWKGIVIDSKLNFSEYIHMASKIANAMAVTRRSL